MFYSFVTPDEILRPVPGPPGPHDLLFPEAQRGAVSDTSRAADEIQQYLRGFREVDIETADGQRMLVLAKNVQPAEAAAVDGSRPCWHCRIVSPGVVNVARGLIEWEATYGGDGNSIHLAKKTWTVPETQLTGLIDGDLIYCSVEYSPGERNALSNVVTSGGDGIGTWEEAGFVTSGLAQIRSKRQTGEGDRYGLRDFYQDQNTLAAEKTADVAARTKDTIGYDNPAYPDWNPNASEHDAKTGEFFYPLAIYNETNGTPSIDQIRLGAPIKGCVFNMYKDS